MSTNYIPARFSFFVEEFSRHVKAAETNEVSAGLFELCNIMETLAANENHDGGVDRIGVNCGSTCPQNEKSEDNNDFIEG